jgi:autotransporter adhesin
LHRTAGLREDAAMLRIAVVLVVALGCSKAKKEEAPPAPPPTPAAADAAPVVAADAAAAGSGSAAAGSGSDAAGSGSSADTGSAAGSGSAVVAASDFDFSKLSKDEKIKFMKQKVMPTMKPLFQKFDAKNFANFTCKTCHGKDPQGTKYKMPSADLPKLDFEAIKAGKEDPKAVEFMSKTVKPEMAKLLAQPEMTESQPKGFGCLACHQMKKK